jgi:hypothetical protein
VPVFGVYELQHCIEVAFENGVIVGLVGFFVKVADVPGQLESLTDEKLVLILLESSDARVGGV